MAAPDPLQQQPEVGITGLGGEGFHSEPTSEAENDAGGWAVTQCPLWGVGSPLLAQAVQICCPQGITS